MSDNIGARHLAARDITFHVAEDDSADLSPYRDAALAAGYREIVLDCGLLRDGVDLLDAIFAAFELPDVGRDSWDSASDWLRDLSWFKETKFLVIIRGATTFQARAKKPFVTFVGVLRDAVVWHRDVSNHMFCLVLGDSSLYDALLETLERESARYLPPQRFDPRAELCSHFVRDRTPS
jgi:hypothetical protein